MFFLQSIIIWTFFSFYLIISIIDSPYYYWINSNLINSIFFNAVKYIYIFKKILFKIKKYFIFKKLIIFLNKHRAYLKKIINFFDNTNFLDISQKYGIYIPLDRIIRDESNGISIPYFICPTCLNPQNSIFYNYFFLFNY